MGPAAGPPRPQPPLELPTDPLGDGRGRQGAVGPPEPFDAVAGVGPGHHQHAAAGQPARAQRPVQLVGQGLGRERGPVDPLCGRIERHRDPQVHRRGADQRREPLPTRRQLVQVRSTSPEAGEHVGGLQRGEPAEGSQTQATQHVDQLGRLTTQHLQTGHRQWGQEARGRPRHDHDRGGTGCAATGLVGHQPRGAGAVGDPHADGDRPGDVELHLDRPPHCGQHLVGQRPVTAVVARRPPGGHQAPTGLDDLQAGGQVLQRGEHRLEGPDVARLVAVVQLHRGTPGLGLAAAEAGHDPLGPRRRAGGDHPVGGHHRHRPVRGRADGHHRPVGAAHRQGPHRGPLGPPSPPVL